ncbi:hypothetical protein [Aureimonas populi]|uniref:Holin n=1 Tax=Aureimonas populi TaxID=1701758 RepID=A0ABW5CIC7_9HYPH|nr:hypothetical protein [Aureimonas populi]
MTKNWYRSKTIWGAGIAFAGAVASLFGVEASTEANEALSQALTNAVSAVGALLAIFGRFAAHEPLK